MGIQFDILAKMDISRRDLLILMRTLRQSTILGEVTVLTDNKINVKGDIFFHIPIPRLVYLSHRFFDTYLIL